VVDQHVGQPSREKRAGVHMLLGVCVQQLQELVTVDDFRRVAETLALVRYMRVLLDHAQLPRKVMAEFSERRIVRHRKQTWPGRRMGVVHRSRYVSPISNRWNDPASYRLPATTVTLSGDSVEVRSLCCADKEAVATKRSVAAAAAGCAQCIRRISGPLVQCGD